jgi:hypothetical protein
VGLQPGERRGVRLGGVGGDEAGDLGRHPRRVLALGGRAHEVGQQHEPADGPHGAEDVRERVVLGRAALPRKAGAQLRALDRLEGLLG